jgi:hypothetical protein
MALTPEKEAAFVELLKTEYLILCGAVLATVESGDIERLYGIAKALPALSSNPAFKQHIARIDAQRAAQAEQIAELSKPAPKKARGPSPWGYGT